MLKYNVGDKLIVVHNSETKHHFSNGERVEIIDKCIDGTKDEHYFAKSLSSGAHWYVNESELKAEREVKLQKYRILSVDDVDVDRGFRVGQIIEAELVNHKYGNVRVYGKYTLFGHQVELVQEGEKTMDMKHDGYVVLSLTDGLFSYNLTKEQAEQEVDFYLKDGVDAENILVFPPNSNLSFTHGVNLMEGE